MKTTRPHIPQYGIPDHEEGLLPWSFVTERLAKARNYWVATTRPDSTPHAVPVWGVFVDGFQFFSGGMHLESGDEVVIIEGRVELVSDPESPHAKPVDAAYVAKYQMPHGLPIWKLHPRAAFAWSKFPNDTTRWVFD
jgi:hypothetical protein